MSKKNRAAKMDQGEKIVEEVKEKTIPAEAIFGSSSAIINDDIKDVLIADALTENFNNILTTYFQRQRLTLQLYSTCWDFYANLWINMNPFKQV